MGFKQLKRAVREKIFAYLGEHMDADRWADYCHNLAETFEDRRLWAFLERTDFSTLDVSNYPVRYITSGTESTQLLSMAFCNQMLRISIFCLYKHWLPRIDVRPCGESGEWTDNLWECYLEQPYASEDERLNSRDGWGKCCFQPQIFKSSSFPTQKEVRVLSKLYQPPLFQLKPEISAYIEDEYKKIFISRGNPRVCGVLCRGTDFRYAKYHPKQPEIPDMIDFIRDKMRELNCEYIYLATEEYRIQEQFDKAFPGKVLINKRRYYDSFYDLREKLGDVARIGMVHGDRENDDYYKGLEYLSSITLLSRCQALIAGTCAGSRTALYMNGGRYEYWHLFDLGINEEGVDYTKV